MVDDSTPAVCGRVYVGSCRGSVAAFVIMLPWSYERLLLKTNNDYEMMLVWVVEGGMSFFSPPNLAVYQATYGSYFSSISSEML